MPQIVFGLYLVTALLLLSAMAEQYSSPPAGSASRTQATKILYVAADVWLGDTNADGSGAYYDIIRRLFEPLGYRIQHRVLPMRRGIAAIHSGAEIDILLADWSREHLRLGGQYQMDRVLIPEHPMSVEYVIASFPPQSTLRWADIATDKSKRVAWVKGYNYHKHLALDEHAITRISNSTQGIKMLYTGHIDCFLDDQTEVSRLLKQDKFKKVSLRQEVVMMRKLYPIFHNDKEGRALMHKYDEGMAALISSGEIYPLYLRYGKNYRAVQADEIAPPIANQ
ncbi:transporter substrate-binding domain-containing protein [Dasania sp. GY-MA-18]|uniref:Transporter substrate-binding domain-containing protein n=1 Tax=Dasania phycosphaerae TaxID=2950436 RepID=A0A9J6RN18_9GAMM|nr:MULTISPECIES: transporter substrate-binding domain-containing protein [Dasania]MCR8923273.1 transporter substrate-binding domain-containing protein [Dasania sp. GY-MA-18]MCZ0865705.1 transporter substrate-binding domain-containing protein [Dasania phycosphaerae]MCZ0869430.1 transporter substrate-binding domain-containing protein [Dasania phycosphaerae]